MIQVPDLLVEDDLDPDLLEGINNYDRQDWFSSLEPLTKAAKRGNITALFKLANSLDNLGREDEALLLWELAAKAGHSGACNNIAIRLRKSGNIEAAKALYRSAADAGSAEAMFNYAQFFEETEEYEQYRFWMKRAAEAGHLRAQAILGDHLYRAGHENEGLEILEDAVDRGSLTAHLLLARIAFENEEFEQAYQLSSKAIELPLVSDDRHLLGNVFALRGVSADFLGKSKEAIADVLKAHTLGFDVRSVPLHLWPPDLADNHEPSKPSQKTKHWATFRRGND